MYNQEEEEKDLRYLRYFGFRRNYNEYLILIIIVIKKKLGKILYNSLQYTIDKIHIQSVLSTYPELIRNRHRFFDTFLFLLQICEILRLAQQPDRFHVFRYPSLRRRVQRIRIEKKKKEKEKRGRVICCTPLQRCHGDIKPI